MKKEKIELAKNILIVVATTGVMAMLIIVPGLSRTLKMFNYGNKDNRRKFQRSLSYLRQKKLVKTYYKDGQEFVEITELGKKRKLSYDFESMRVKKTKTWDGLFHVVIFDIPEKNKKARKLLRYKLEDMGFYPIQDSVMISPYECMDEVEFLKEYLFIKEHIRYLVVKDIDNKEQLKNFFGL